jgi:hypothetical protein
MKSLTNSDYQHVQNIKMSLKEKYGDLISQIYCYGSRVLVQKQDTDFDLMVITTEKIDWRMEDTITDTIYYYGLQNDILFDVRYFSLDEVENKYKHMPFITEVKRYGIAI